MNFDREGYTELQKAISFMTEEERRRGLQEITDYIRSELVLRIHSARLPFGEQARSIHAAHLSGREEYVLSEPQVTSLSNFFRGSRLGGVLRSPQELPVNIFVAGNIAKGADFHDNSALYRDLSAVADELFPYDGHNPVVDEQSIYHYLSAIQSSFAIIHPFFEANGRTSEDALYPLWMRRPDLSYTVRYVSDNGMRNSANVTKRGDLINRNALKLIHEFGEVHGLLPEELAMIHTYSDLQNMLSFGDGRMNGEYQQYFFLKMSQSIQNIREGNIFEDCMIRALAANLRGSSTSYTLVDGASL